MPRIDAHLHVFTKASSEFPREISDVWPAEREEPVEKLLDEMEKHQIDQAVLVQMAGTSIEQHRYLLHCLKAYPNRFLGIGLLPEGHPNPADHMAELTDETGIIGFRFSTFGGPRDIFAKMDVREFEAYPIWKCAAERDYVLWPAIPDTRISTGPGCAKSSGCVPRKRQIQLGQIWETSDTGDRLQPYYAHHLSTRAH